MSQQIKILKSVSVPNIVTDFEKVLTDICNTIELKLNDADLLAMTVSGAPDKKWRSINDLDDVDAGDAEDGDILIWNESTAQWENVPHVINNLIDVDVSNVSDGNTLVWNESTAQWEAGSAAGGQQPLTSDIELTVGNGGDYSTINEALAFAVLTYYPVLLSTGKVPRVTVRLLPGFVMNEQVIVESIDLSWITIVGDDDMTMIDRSALVTPVRIKSPEFPGGGPITDQYIDGYPAFAAINGGFLPVISQLFVIEGSDDPYAMEMKCGVVAQTNSRAIVSWGCGVINADGIGICADGNSRINAEGAQASMATLCGICANGASVINAPYADVSYTVNYGIYAGQASTVNASYANTSHNASNWCMFAYDGSTISAPSANASMGFNGICALKNSRINADGIDVSSSHSIAIRASEASTISASHATALDAGYYGIYASQASMINASYADASYAGHCGIRAENGSTINASYANASESSENGVSANNGSTINADFVDASNAGSCGLAASRNSKISASNAILSGAFDYGIDAFSNSAIYAPEADTTYSWMGIAVDDGSIVAGDYIDVSNTDFGMWANNNSIICSYYITAYDIWGNGANAEMSSILYINGIRIRECGAPGIVANEASIICAGGADLFHVRDIGIWAGYTSTIYAYSTRIVQTDGWAIHISDNSSIYADYLTAVEASECGIFALNNSLFAGVGIDVSDAGEVGIYALFGSTIVIGGGTYKNIPRCRGGRALRAGKYGIYADYDSRISACNVDVSDAGIYGVYARCNSNVDVYGSVIHNAGTNGIYADISSTVVACLADISAVDSHGVYAGHFSKIDAYGATSTSDNGYGYMVDHNSLINAEEANGTLSQTPGVRTSNGLILQ